MAKPTGFITKETKEGKKRVPIIGKLWRDHEKKKEEFELNEENIRGLTGYSDQHRQAIMMAAQKLTVYQAGYSANYKEAMQDVRYLHSLMLKGVDTHDIFELLMGNPAGAAQFIKNMGLENVSVADSVYVPGRSNLIGSNTFQQSHIPVANMGIIPVGNGLYMGLSDKSTFYYMVRNKNLPPVLYPIETMQPAQFAEVLRMLSNTQYIGTVLGNIQKFNEAIAGLIGTGVPPNQQAGMNYQQAGMNLGGSFFNPNAGVAQQNVNVNATPGGGVGAESAGGDERESNFGPREASRVLVSGVEDLRPDEAAADYLRQRIGGKASRTAKLVAAYAAMGYNMSATTAAKYISGQVQPISATGRELSNIGEQLKRGKFNQANRFMSSVQAALVTKFVKDNPNQNLPTNPVEFAKLVESNSKLKDKWTDFISDTSETSDAYDDYLEAHGDDEDDGKN